MQELNVMEGFDFKRWVAGEGEAVRFVVTKTRGRRETYVEVTMRDGRLEVRAAGDHLVVHPRVCNVVEIEVGR